MTSLFAQLFLALQAQIKTNVLSIKWIDQDLGQLEYYETRPMVDFPCVLIDFPTANYSNLGNGVQWAEISISIRLGFAPFSSASSVSPDISKEAALQFYELENQLFAALEGFDANGCVQPIVRTTAATERRNDPYRIRELIFTTATEDDSVLPSIQKQNANMTISNNPI